MQLPPVRRDTSVKLITYLYEDAVSCGVLTDRGVVDIPSSWKDKDRPASVKEILERGASCLDRARQLASSARATIPLDSVRLLAPIPRPGKVLALAGNYSEHLKEGSGHHGT